MHCGYIVEVKELRPHNNADKLQLATFFGETVIVGLDTKIGDIGIYFPCDIQLSEKYCDANDLCRKKADGSDGNGYLERDKRNVKAINLRGERSFGLYAPLESLAWAGDVSTLKLGDAIDIFNGYEICCKYIPRSNKRAAAGAYGSKRSRRKKIKVELPYFEEHIDTPQLRFCPNMFKPGDIICLTEKIHGTSSRNANTLSITYKKNLLDKIFGLKGHKIERYVDVIGTRRTIVSQVNGGYYGSNQFRVDWGEKFKNKLYSGETVFGEIAGWIDDSTPIMGVANNKKTKDKEFIKKYGDTTTFTYGCEHGKSRFFIYRMTCTGPDGNVIEYPWDLVKLRAEQMGFEVVPELDRFIYTTEEDFNNRIQRWMDVSSTIDNTHIIEGVVVRALNAPDFKVAKEKSFFFKVIEGIIKDTADVPDIEEAEEDFKNL